MSLVSRFARCSAVVEGGKGVERTWKDMMVIGSGKDRSRSRVLDLRVARSCGGRVQARAAVTMSSFGGGGKCASFEPGGTPGRTSVGGLSAVMRGR